MACSSSAARTSKSPLAWSPDAAMPISGVACARAQAIQACPALGQADAEACQVELARRERTRVLGRLAADERAVDLLAGIRDRQGN